MEGMRLESRHEAEDGRQAEGGRRYGRCTDDYEDSLLSLIRRFLATMLPGLMKDLSAHLSCLAAPQRHKWTVISLTGLTKAANVLSEKLIKR